MNLSDISKFTEEQARDYFEHIRWPNGPFCPHCASTKWIKLAGKSHRPGLYRCHGGDCGKQFTATVNTILEDSHLPIRLWLMTFAILTTAKKGISALQLQRQLGIGSYRSAWHLCHRIRHAMGKEPMKGLLLGAGGKDVAVDETWVGGRPSRLPPKQPGERRKKRPTQKQPVVALIERGGGGHVAVDHSKGEYSRDGLGTNEAEAYFALLKRGITGSFHHVSKKHLQRYVDEFSYRWDRRKMSDGERTVDAIKTSEGKRLMLKEPIRKEKLSPWDL